CSCSSWRSCWSARSALPGSAGGADLEIAGSGRRRASRRVAHPWNRREVRLHEPAARLVRKEEFPRVVRQHDAGVQQARVAVDEVVGRACGRRSLHEMPHGEEPGPGQRLMVLRSVDSLVPDEVDQCRPHQPRGDIVVVPCQVDIGEPEVGAMVEALGGYQAGLEAFPEAVIAGRGRVYHGPPGATPRPAPTPAPGLLVQAPAGQYTISP